MLHHYEYDAARESVAAFPKKFRSMQDKLMVRKTRRAKTATKTRHMFQKAFVHNSRGKSFHMLNGTVTGGHCPLHRILKELGVA